MIVSIMARSSKPPIPSEQIRGLKHLRQITSLLQRLHADATARDKAHNRTLFFDQYASLVLISLFSPAIDSLRAISQASAMPKVRRLLGCSRVSLGSLSEAARVFDPSLLLEVIAELSRELLPLRNEDARLDDIRKTLTLCDGTLLRALPRLAESMWKHSRTGNVMHGWRMHCQFELDRHVPGEVQFTPYGATDEPAVLAANLKPGRCYVMDRGYHSYRLFDAIVAVGSDYVCRIKKNISYELMQERELTVEARAAGVTRDRIVTAGSTADTRANHAVRLIEVRVEVQPRGARGEGKPQAPPKTEVLLIATNLLEVPAELIALIYRYRWTIELFFRFFKQILGCRHLISDDPDGIRIQCYCAVIACMLLQLFSGKRPNKEMHRMVSFYLCGWATEQDVLDWMNKPDNTGVKLRAKAELWKKLGY